MRLTTIIVLAVLAAGCVKAVTLTPTLTPEPPLDAQTILERVAIRLSDLRSAAFVLEHPMGSTTLFPGLEMHRVTGVVDVGDEDFRIVVEAQSQVPRVYIEFTVVNAGEEVWMTDFLTGNWREVPKTAMPLDFSNLGGTLIDITSAVESPELLGLEYVSGIETRRIRGTMQSEELAGLVPGAGGGVDIVVDLWVEVHQSLVYQMVLAGQVLSTDKPDTERLLSLGEFNLPVVIDPPE